MNIVLLSLYVASFTARMCGKGVKSCPSGQCCSIYGYCGKTKDYCGSNQCDCDCNGKKPCMSSDCEIMYINGVDVIQRSGPGTNYEKKKTFSKGDPVCVVSTTNGWAKLIDGTYVFAKYLSSNNPSSCQKMYINGVDVIQRSGPGTNYEKKKTFSKGDAVCVVSTANGWAKLIDGTYVFAKYLSSNNPSNNPSPSSSTIEIKHTKIRDALKQSKWSSKADMLTYTYDMMKDNGYDDKVAVGLMANFAAEGRFGLVEYSFSTGHNFSFFFPSGSKDGKAKTIKDIEYLRDWTTKSSDKIQYKNSRGEIVTVKKESCGFGSAQWSGSRRVQFAKFCLEIMKKDSDVNTNNWVIAESQFIPKELKNGNYFTKISKAAKGKGGSVEAWAEAFTDKYEIPWGCDGNMSATGSECKKRRGIAREMYDLFVKENAF